MAGITSFFSILTTLDLMPQVQKALKVLPDELVTKAAQEIADLAAVNAPELTGFLASSIYIKTHTQSTYGQNAITPPGDSYLLEEAEDPGSGSAYVAVGANYGIFVEFGTRNMGAQPYLIPAAEQVRVDFEGGALFNNVFTNLMGGL